MDNTEISQFKEVVAITGSHWMQTPETKEIREENNDLDERFIAAQLTDLVWQRWSRLGFAVTITILLAVQTWAIFSLIWQALEYGALQHLQLFLGTLMTGTLLQTYKVLTLMVDWLFKTKPYKPDHKQSKSKK